MDGAADSAGGVISGNICFVPPAGGDSPADLSGQVHLLPCVIKHDGRCPVSHYFRPRPTGEVSDGLHVEEAFFRGRKLQGASISFPDGFSGYVLSKEERTGKEEGASNCNEWVERGEFRTMKYWNHDSLPSPDDPLLRCFHWFSVSDALHGPITASDMASLSLASPKKAL